MSKGKIIFVVVAFLAISFFFFNRDKEGQGIDIVKTQVYKNSVYGFSFIYRDTYDLSTKEDNAHFELVLVDQDVMTQNQSEGPVSIRIDVYKNIDLETWLKKNESNFNLATIVEDAIPFQGMKAVRYNWDGLYLGKTIAFSRGGDVFALAGTYLEKGDSHYTDFENIIESFILENVVNRKDLIVEYLKKNISALSPEKEVLGGTYYVTKFTDIDNNSGILEYEDGHNAYIAKVLYSLDNKGGVQISSFEIIK